MYKRQKYATAMLSCKEATTAMAQELKQPVYVKPNLTAENGKPFQGDLSLIHILYASMGIVVNRDNPVKRVKDKYLFISMSIF